MGVNNIHCLGWTLALNSIHRQRVYLLAGGVPDWSGGGGGNVSSGLVALGEAVAVVGLV